MPSVKTSRAWRDGWGFFGWILSHNKVTYSSFKICTIQLHFCWSPAESHRSLKYLVLFFLNVSTEDSCSVWARLRIACPSPSDLHVNWFAMFIAKCKKQVSSVERQSDSCCTLFTWGIPSLKSSNTSLSEFMFESISPSSSHSPSLHPSICILFLFVPQCCHGLLRVFKTSIMISYAIISPSSIICCALAPLLGMFLERRK